MNNKGFVFIESVIVTVLILILSIPLYVLSKNAIHSFEIRKTYDSSEHLYDLNAIKVFLYRNYDVNGLCDYINDVSGTYNKNYDTILPLYQRDIINNMSFDSDDDTRIFEALVSDMRIKKLFFTNFNINLNVNGTTTNKVNSDYNLKRYIEYLNKDKTSDKYLYRLIAEFDDGNFASINMYRIG